MGCYLPQWRGELSYFYFGDQNIAIVMAVAMIANLLVAGLSGTSVLVGLMRASVDPAVAFSILVTTITNVVGFFVFFGVGGAVFDLI